MKASVDGRDAVLCGDGVSAEDLRLTQAEEEAESEETVPPQREFR